MAKPDRFERTVDRLPLSHGGTGVCNDDVVKLLRRQHAAVVRLVKETFKKYPLGGTYESDVLKALAQWKRGTK